MPTDNRVSTVLARRLGGELLRLRDAAGLTQPQAAQVLSATAAKVAKMERGWVPFRDPDIVALCKLYGETDESAVAGLLALAKLDRERRKAKGWWQQVPTVGGFAEYVAMEDVATRIRTWQLALVPGLLQTSDYIRALGVSSDSWTHPDEIEVMVTTRTRRQNRLWGERPLEFHAIVWEAALRQEIGGRAVMAGQLAHLVEKAHLPNIHIQVLPFRVGAAHGVGGAFNILSFAEQGALDVGYTESVAATVWAEGAEANERFRRAFDRLSRLSLAPHDSVNLIDAICKGFQA
ncbi:helix-turn-helix domain-containing protein [Streptomyces sp. NBC_00335]|uniref:helix-turn-helix domain-containing protein n=1 Tax=unclassified Streptomyces TaxID=2593676 RepID=UPI00224E6D9B|nr:MULTISPECIES: helix-turn-helix transcriptional regulator [unclassified Streptomyces]MCX5405890.1 helix-turn-helix domain-containing protein [Streptomyces sp. NBC_00086]